MRLSCATLILAVLSAGCTQSTYREDSFQSIDVVVPSGRWIDIVVPLSPLLHDSDVNVNVTWILAPEAADGMAKLEYYGLTRDGYMGGQGWQGIGPATVSDSNFHLNFNDVEAAYRTAKQEGYEDVVYHIFVLIAGPGEATMRIQVNWRETNLLLSYGTEEDQWFRRLSDFKPTTSEQAGGPGYVSLDFHAENGARSFAMAFDASIPNGDPLLEPRYQRSDGTIQKMKADLALDFSGLEGGWTLARQAPIANESDRIIAWGAYFDAADRIWGQPGNA